MAPDLAEQLPGDPPPPPEGDANSSALEKRREGLRAILGDLSASEIPEALDGFHAPEIAEILDDCPPQEQLRVLRALSDADGADIFEDMGTEDQAELLQEMRPRRALAYLEELPPDKRADLLGELGSEKAEPFLALLQEEDRQEAEQLLSYGENTAGGRMTTDFAWLSPQDTVGRALEKMREDFKEVEMIYYLYVLDPQRRILGLVTLRHLLAQAPAAVVGDIMAPNIISMPREADQEVVARELALYDFFAMPVVDQEKRMLGIVTFDDLLDVSVAEATEDIQKIGGMEALDEPYIATPFWTLIRKRAGWLLVLFLGETLTATAMSRFEDQLAQAVVLALFIPLIISSGGNSGSQAASLIIRALAVGEVAVRDWWRIMRREALSGLVLGMALGMVGFARIALWSSFSDIYGPHWLLVAVTIWISLVGVVLWGTLSGSMLPLLLKRMGLDPAVSSAPFVATLVDVTGIVIYFEAASIMLRGTLL